MSDDFEIDLDDLIDVLPDDEVDALLKDLDLGDFEEDADMIQHGDNDRVDPAKSRDAKKRYNLNRNTYRKAFDKFRRSSRGKLFYKKLSRFNQRPSTIMKKDTETVESLIDKVLAGETPTKVVEMVESETVLPDSVKLFYKPKLSDFKVGSTFVQPDKSGQHMIKAKVKSIDQGMITSDQGGQYTPDELRLLK